jgi:two-component system, OmpR family, response regulator
MAKVLVVEDDTGLCTVIRDWLLLQNYLVEIVHTAGEAEEFLRSYRYDAIVLDWGLPDRPGVDVCQRFRASGGQTPILMLTGKRDISEKEQGLDSGADDYLTKPFDVKELSARLRALLRRPAAMSENVLSAGDLLLDPSKYVVTKGGAEVKLFRKEFALLEFLMRHPNKVFSPESLLNHVWASEAGVGPETVRTSVKRLRQQIDDEGRNSLIENVRGVGYRLKLPE